MSEKKTETVKKTTAVKKSAAKKPAVKKAVPKAKEVEYIIQSPMGGEITTAEILKKVGNADKIYIRVDQNKAYWIRGKESGSVELW